MPFRAKLDHDDIYWGESEEVAELAPSDPPVPDEAIRPGAYRWMAPDANHPQWRFAPLQPFEVKPTKTAPSLEEAFHALVSSLEEAGHALPAAVAAWRAWFKNSIDMRGRG